MTENCKNCKFFYVCCETTKEFWGRCHRHAPRPPHTRDWLWPAVDADDFCGEFKQAEYTISKGD